MVERQSETRVEGLVFRLPIVRVPVLHLAIPKPTTPLSTTVLLTYGFAALIIIGAILLTMPFSSKAGNFTSPLDALFTATSAVCVTGLGVFNTGAYWSTFGQAVIFVLFQIGGLGFIIGATILLLALGRRFGLREKLFITESVGTEKLGGVLGVVIGVAIFSLVAEGIGVIIFYFNWLADGNTDVSLWTAVFHAASAFTNCGFDIFNTPSLSSFQGDAVTLLTTAFLVILGGIGFVVATDIMRKRSFARFSLDSKIVLSVSAVLLIIGTLFYFIIEFSGPRTLGTLPVPQKILVSFVQAVVPRTAGFTAIDIGSLKQVSLFFTMFLMLIGGASGSVAGGIKVATLGILVITAVNLVRGRENIEVFGRQLTRQTVYRAMTLVIFYLGAVSLTVIVLSLTEAFPIEKVIFETFSAFSTVGLSTGITSELSAAGRIIITIAMFLGRLGPISLMAVIEHRKQPLDISYPQETIRLG